MESIKQHLSTIINTVCVVYDINRDTLLSKDRTQRIADARHACFYLSRIFTKKTLAYIAQQMNRKDHTTVMHGLKQVNNMQSYDKNYQSKIEECIELLGA